VARVKAVLDRAELILHLVPPSDEAPTAMMGEMLQGLSSRVLEIRTQADLAPGAGLRISAATGDLDALEKALKIRFLGGQAPDALLGALATARQIKVLDALAEQVAALEGLPVGAPPELAASLLQGAWGLLLRLTGEDRAEASLDELFSGFCLGK
jgi:tRNA modification GTPase